MIKALEYRRSVARYVVARSLGSADSVTSAGKSLALSLAPIRLTTRKDPHRPNRDWARVRPVLAGICGSDLALLTARGSPYLSGVSSMPFVPGHEVVGELLDDLDEMPAGTTVVIDPVLSCRVRAVDMCRWCARRRENRCDHIASGSIAPALQTGFCTDTGGGWSHMLVAHREQLHPVPPGLPVERAVLVEPLACAVHSVGRTRLSENTTVVVVGAGTIGLLTVLALRHLTAAEPIVVIARHPRQRQAALQLGATEALDVDSATRWIRRRTRASMRRPALGTPYLLGGADVAFECTGSGSGQDVAARTVRAGGRIILAGIPTGGPDLAPVWFRELTLIGSYATCSRGTAVQSSGPAGPRDGDFATAIHLLAQTRLDKYVDGFYGLDDWREGLAHALNAGRLGSIKIVFNPQ